MTAAGASADPSAILGRLIVAFEGERLPAWMADRLASEPAAGVTLFRFANVASPGQVRELTDALQAASRRRDPLAPPLLIAADQEGGQLMALGDGPTAFAGNMALGAVGDADLARRVGRAIGTELRAMGVSLAYAPVLDVATNPSNPAIGIRSFGDDPAEVGRLGAAFVRGLHSAGVAAAGKHFPGLGDVSVDTHHELASVARDRARLDAVELAPYRPAISAGLDVVMSGHVALPAVTGRDDLPATLSPVVMGRLLRRDLGFRGVTLTDALDMAALAQGDGQVVDVIAAIRAGVDLLLCSPDRAARERIEDGLRRAAARDLFDPAGLARSAGRVERLRRRLGPSGALGRRVRADLADVGGHAHKTLARELAERSVTLVRDDAGVLPLHLAADARVLAVMPSPRDLTPADTSSTVPPGLAAALRRVHPGVEEIVTSHPPTTAEIAAARARAREVDLVVIGTINAAMDHAQVELVEAVLGAGKPVVTVALRVPTDLAAYPESLTHLATYSILPDSLAALADILVGRLEPTGRSPMGFAASGRPATPGAVGVA